MILVSGGAGYIGSHTVLELKDKGYEVIVIDNLYSGHREFVPDDVKFLNGDIRDSDFLSELFKKHSIDAVIHFAGLSLVGESVKLPELYYQANIGGTASLISAMRKKGVKKIIFSYRLPR